ncbi:MAG: putative peptidoglycan binding domain [Thermoleophilia bacterium]|nr:putative peptidoglycan binding domain [Thermoleophilia bacterium]
MSSGLAARAYSFDDGATFQASPSHAPARGETQVHIAVRDRVGNVQRVVVDLDRVPPSIMRNGRWLRGLANADTRFMRFDFDDASAGVASASVKFRGRTVPIAGGRLDLRSLPEGSGTLRLTVLDHAGNSARWSARLLVDRTAPTLRGAQTRHVFGSTVSLAVSDRLSGPQARTVRARLTREGRQVVRVRVRDRAGNVAQRSIVVTRHVSLARPALNRGLRLRGSDGVTFTPHGDAMRDVFRFRSTLAPWYGHVVMSQPLVREVQWRLKRFGFLSCAVSSSGRLDLTTLGAIKRFQHAHDIPSIATVGPLTRAALDAELLRRASQTAPTCRSSN